MFCFEGTCPPRWVRANDTCYYYSYYKMTWNEAEEYCKDAVSQLAVPGIVAERDIVRILFPFNDLWIGCKKHNGSNDLQCQENRTVFLGKREKVPLSSNVIPFICIA